MFGIGMPEMILIVAIALIVIGPKKLPDLAKSIGRALGEFKRAAGNIKESIDIDHEFEDVETIFDHMKDTVKKPVNENTVYDTTENKDHFQGISDTSDKKSKKS